ncbi:MAG: hypothetical protein PHD48_12860, partial [Alphaproteobacteria bacterium]|nr:hypothetical protein [Alphaproteobacteria bacterium]
SKGRFEELQIFLPSDETPIHAIHLFYKLIANQKIRGDISKLCGTLIPILLSGEIRIPEAEKLLEAHR